MAQIINHVSSDEYELLCEEKNFWNLDVREVYEFEDGHIKGSKLVPATNFDEEFGKLGVKKTDKIGLYCRTGSRSDFIAEVLKNKGYKKIYNLERGIIEWSQYGKKLKNNKI